MPISAGLDTVPVRTLRGVGLVRLLNRVLPLDRKWHRLLGVMNSDEHLLAVPFGEFEMVFPAVWRKLIADFLLAADNVVPEMSLVRRLCEDLPEGAVVDVGANMGVYTMKIGALTRRPIVAFEPVPFMYDLFRRNLEHNHIDGVDTRRMACGREVGEIKMVGGMNGAVAFGDELKEAIGTVGNFSERARNMLLNRDEQLSRIPVMPLDESMKGEQVSLLKIDVEGYELQVLQGAEQLLKRCRPRIFIEVHPDMIGRYGGSVQELMNLLEPQYEMEIWDFKPPRSRIGLVNSVLKNRATQGRILPDIKAMVEECAADRKPLQLYIVGKPK